MQSPVWIPLHGTPHLDIRLASKPTNNEYFNIFDNEIDVWSPLLCQEEAWFVKWCIKHYLSRAAIHELLRNRTMASGSIFTAFLPSFERLNEMSCVMRINSWNSDTLCSNGLANPINFSNDDSTCILYHNPVECIEFLMKKLAFREHMSYAPAKEFNDAEECIYSEVKSSNWWCNDVVH